jgi:hypothetical protein
MTTGIGVRRRSPIPKAILFTYVEEELAKTPVWRNPEVTVVTRKLLDLLLFLSTLFYLSTYAPS